MTINNILPNMVNKKQVEKEKDDFQRFVKTCKDELRKYKCCICFDMKHIKELERCFNINYEKVDYYYLVTLKEA